MKNEKRMGGGKGWGHGLYKEPWAGKMTGENVPFGPDLGPDMKVFPPANDLSHMVDLMCKGTAATTPRNLYRMSAMDAALERARRLARGEDIKLAMEHLGGTKRERS